jgi:hypothetical protein
LFPPCYSLDSSPTDYLSSRAGKENIRKPCCSDRLRKLRHPPLPHRSKRADALYGGPCYAHGCQRTSDACFRALDGYRQAASLRPDEG